MADSSFMSEDVAEDLVEAEVAEDEHELLNQTYQNTKQNEPLAVSQSRNSLLHTSLATSISRVSPQVINARTRLQHFRDARRTMTEGLLNANEDLLDLANGLQARVTALELETEYLRRESRHSPLIGHDIATPANTRGGLAGKRYAVVILDADSYCFRQEFLVDAANGGHRAADELYLRASEYLRQELNVFDAEPISIIVKAYANCHGLCGALSKSGLIKSEKDFDLFVEAFNQRVPLFDFSDVGSGKERADNKIREWLYHYLEQPHCQHVILGCGHDRGYETFLQKFAADERYRNKLTMLDGPTMSINFRSMGFHKRLAMWTVFAAEPLSRRNPPPASKSSNISLAQRHAGQPGPANQAIVPQSKAQSQNQAKRAPASPAPSRGSRVTNQTPAPNPAQQRAQQQLQQLQQQQKQQQNSKPPQGGSHDKTMGNTAGHVLHSNDTGAALAAPVDQGNPNRARQNISHTPDITRNSTWRNWWDTLSGANLHS